MVTKDLSITATFTVTPLSPTVIGFSPTTATLNEQTTFTITGTNLPDTLSAFIEECRGSGANDSIIVNGGSSTRKTFQCTPSFTAGSKNYLIKDQPNGTTLNSGTVVISEEEDNTPPTSPTVTGFSPTTATLNEQTTFTITGTNLPDTLSAFIEESRKWKRANVHLSF